VSASYPHWVSSSSSLSNPYCLREAIVLCSSSPPDSVQPVYGFYGVSEVKELESASYEGLVINLDGLYSAGGCYAVSRGIRVLRGSGGVLTASASARTDGPEWLEVSERWLTTRARMVPPLSLLWGRGFLLLTCSGAEVVGFS
jgi:hypothetical protein